MSERVRRIRCFFVTMEPTLYNVSESLHAAALEKFFLPAFAEAGTCILCGAVPATIAPPVPGLAVEAGEIGWTIARTEAFQGTFPYWNYVAADRFSYRLMVCLDLAQHEPLLEQILGEAWDPKWFDNPQAAMGTESLRYIKRTSSKRSVVWLSYGINPSTMDIALVASANNIVPLYERAIGAARAKYTVPLNSDELQRLTSSWRRKTVAQ